MDSRLRPGREEPGQQVELEAESQQAEETQGIVIPNWDDNEAWEFVNYLEDPNIQQRFRNIRRHPAAPVILMCYLAGVGEFQTWDLRQLIGKELASIHANKTVKYYNGAKVLTGPYKNSRDSVGHGTHTSSTAAGRLVPHTSKRRGGAPNPRIAVYEVCWTDSCKEVDIAAGFDDAINDGVDVLSISLGGYLAVYSVDVIAIGAYHAVERGIMVFYAGGNSGPFTGSVSNGALWIFTVGATTIDREINEDAKISAKYNR
ncbi:hypothetical protein SELMODRAFT_414624 [Selaginella moellendorffii]|uniref:Peptidase S8/S53 domain-containing protein n=1 Tax=Selaginella moellendorffii TaxID=88036 RepID=D8RTE2_SELML|nr:hypothetical protein SELMODRAFT_414624 [Selaginella moellendorffii]